VWNNAFGLFTLASTGNTTTLTGGIAGGQLGYNYPAGNAVFGVELDGQWSGQKKDIISVCPFFFCTITETIKINSFGTLRGRIGVAFDRILVYGTAGAAWISANDNVTDGFNALSVSGSKVGGAAGLGLEVGVSGGFSIKAEYLYMQVNGISGSTAVPFGLGGGTVTETAKIQESIIRIGGNYRF
jgi:outer membrane immunogenic protein